MWLRRLTGGALEVVDGVETKMDEPFEVEDATGKNLLKHNPKDEPRFEQAPKTVAKKAESAAAKEPEAVSTGPGGIPAEEVRASKKPGASKPVARRSD